MINNSLTIENITKHVFYITLFLLISNYLYPFYFGVSDNREEVPALFFINGIGTYLNDEFITRSVNEYNVATPYLYALAKITNKLDFDYYPIFFFLAHQITLVGIFLALKNITQLFSSKLEYLHFFVLIVALEILLRKFPYFIFGGRWLISNYFDPQLVAYAFCFTSIFFFLSNKYNISALFLFVANLLSPLLVTPILMAFFLVLISRTIIENCNYKSLIAPYFTYAISTLPYTLFLYIHTAGKDLSYDHQKIMTEIRSTDLSRIPNIFDIKYGDVFFFGFLFLLIICTFIFLLRRYKGIKNLSDLKHEQSDFSFILFSCFLISLMCLASIISSFFTIQLVYRLDPYRVSVILIPLLFLFISSHLIKNFSHSSKSNKIHTFGLPFVLALTGLFIFKDYPNIASKAEGDRNNYRSNAIYLDAKETISWIRRNTPINSTFLNYADSKNFLTLRTHAIRSQFFSWKTINLTNDGIVNWYKRYLIHYDVSADPYNYKQMGILVGKKGKNIKSVNISSVLDQINYQINYVLVPNDFELRGNQFPEIFRNDSYRIYGIN